MTTICMRRLTTLGLALLLAAAVAPAALAQSEEPVAEEPPIEQPAPKPKPKPRKPAHQVRRVDVTRDIVFPIVGTTRTINGFGSCRDNCAREHHGVDILTYGWKGLPVVASHDGIVTDVRDDGEWCNIQVTGSDGWYTRYVHMNNDSPGYDDEDYDCVPPGIAEGEPVKAGQLIGWVGDSGNAEHTQPHIHYELRMPSGLPVDPLKSLKKAHRIAILQVGTDDLAATAAKVALHAYPYGAPTVTVMSIDDYSATLGGGYVPIELEGPLLLSEWETIPTPTLDALAVLAPARVHMIGDLWLPDVLEQLDGPTELINGAMLERVAAAELGARTVLIGVEDPIGEAVEGFADGIGSVAEAARSAAEPVPAPFAIIFLGDRDELEESAGIAFRSLSARVATTMMDFVEPEGRLGRTAFTGIGRSGSRNTLYFAAGAEWERYRAREAPEESPGYGLFVVDPESLTTEAVAFLRSIADAPVMPLWR